MGLFWVPKYGFVLYPAFLWNKPMLLLFNLDASWSTYLFKLGKTVWCQRINFTKKGFWLVWNVTESSAGRVCGRWCPTERSNDLLLQFHGKKTCTFTGMAISPMEMQSDQYYYQACWPHMSDWTVTQGANVTVGSVLTKCGSRTKIFISFQIHPYMFTAAALTIIYTGIGSVTSRVKTWMHLMICRIAFPFLFSLVFSVWVCVNFVHLCRAWHHHCDGTSQEY